MGRNVAVPVGQFKEDKGRIVLAGATKDALKAIPSSSTRSSRWCRGSARGEPCRAALPGSLKTSRPGRVDGSNPHDTGWADDEIYAGGHVRGTGRRAMSRRVGLTMLLGLMLACAPRLVWAEDDTELAKKTQNPVADLISVPFQNK